MRASGLILLMRSYAQVSTGWPRISSPTAGTNTMRTCRIAKSGHWMPTGHPGAVSQLLSEP
jgi:hypothetical protein